MCEHPLSDLVIAGESVNPLPTVFHTLLQTIADLMLLPPLGKCIIVSTASVQCSLYQGLILYIDFQGHRYSKLLFDAGASNSPPRITCFSTEAMCSAILVKYSRGLKKRMTSQ